ncbi:hypothetical protein [Rhizobium sp. CC-YZS058]|uniref:hypothetical protein n=1 Tax=Rhizobium sp. CC-YZS058 TaxID=3042153 RepID=UPI002B05F2C6|nr:hypothetical protein [Rhizobium sp. CC-YZS058]MEA3534362.1 hypothetical protein [Rhizobium sp. CC-YZS058]
MNILCVCNADATGFFIAGMFNEACQLQGDSVDAMESTQESRREELIGLIRVITYARDGARDVKASAAAHYLEAALSSLVADLSKELGPVIPEDQVNLLLSEKAGHC